MNRYFNYSAIYSGFLVVLLGLAGCRASYQPSGGISVVVTGGRIPVDSVYDRYPDREAVHLVALYQAEVKQAMGQVIGVSAMDMERDCPESLLSNLVADVLLEYARAWSGLPVEFAVMNIGGIRSDLPKGAITIGKVYEILPFENSMCIVTLRGEEVKALFTEIARVRGEAVSNVQVEISAARELLSLQIDGKPVDENRLYTVATVDYLAEGNDGMTAFQRSERCDCPPGETIRSIFMEYVKQQTARGELIRSELDGRCVVKRTNQSGE